MTSATPAPSPVPPPVPDRACAPSVQARVAGACWAAAAPLFLLTNLVVANAWTNPGLDWRLNNISDLGNVTCGITDPGRPRYVCSRGTPR